MQKKFVYAISFSFLFLVVSTKTAQAAQLNVPSQYTTITSAVKASANGDTILVGPGTYREQIDLSGKYIILRASSGPSATTLAPNPGKTAIMIQSVPFVGGVPRTTVDGFKITGGYAPDGQGGAITIANNADPIIQNNVIENNQSLAHGGGILVYNQSSPTIKNNIIQNNYAKSFGGGIFAIKQSNPVIYGNTIQNNNVSGASIVNGGSSGGGIYLENEPTNINLISHPTIVNNTITNNSAQFAGGGIMLRTGVSPVIEGNTITSNSAPYGGGIHIETEGSRPIIANNTISSNMSTYNPSFAGSGHGAGVSVYANSKPYIHKNQILSNTSSYGGAGMVLAELSNSTIESNYIINNQVTQSGGNTEGGGIYISNATAEVSNNLIRSNSGWNGGGIGILGNSTINITNNTIVKNNDTHDGIGGGIFIENANVLVNIRNNIITLNQDYQIYEGNNNKSTMSNNLITNTGTGLYKNASIGAPINTAAALDASSSANSSSTNDNDPQFSDESNESYSLSPSSPARDMGAATNAPREDIVKASRPFNTAYDAGAYEYTTDPAVKKPVYRFWSDELKGHFYTINATEKNAIISNQPVKTWLYEYVRFDAYDTAVAGTIPIYRLWNNTFRAHAYLSDVNEKNTAIANGWTDEGIDYYAYDLSYGGSADTVYRFWSPSFQNHFFTSNEAEKNNVLAPPLNSLWTFDGGRFKVPR